MRKYVRTLILVLLIASSVCSQQKREENRESIPATETSGTTIRYIANEGVLISAGGKQVLIDGLHREYKPAYAFPPTGLRNLLEMASSPYNEIDLLLVSHIHLDHFHPQSVGMHLKHNRQCMLVTSGQVAGEVAKEFAGYEGLKPQITPVEYEWKKSIEMDVNGIKLKLLGLRHANEQHRSIQNFGHLIWLGGKKFLHIGDADMTAENFSGFDLGNENIDIAFIPYWYLMSEGGRRFVKEQFAPKKIIAVHIPPDDAESIAEKIKAFDPDATSFTLILDEKTF